jgi:hypothetical protein
VAFLISNNYATTIGFAISSQLYLSSLLDLTDRIPVSSQIGGSASVISNRIEKSGDLIGSRNIEGSVRFAISQQLGETGKLAISVVIEVTAGALTSKIFYPSIAVIGSALLNRSDGYESSENFVDTKSVRSEAIVYSNWLIISGSAIATRKFEATKSVVITQTLSGSADVGLDGSQSIEGSRNFTISDQFEIYNIGGLENDRTGLSWEGLSAIGAAVIALSLLVLLTVFLLKRRKGNELTDLGLEYETETEANVVNLEEDEFMDEHDGDWDAQDFERALESEFGGPTMEAPELSDQLFPSDCDELF